MAKRSGSARRRDGESLLTRAVDSVFGFVRYAEFEILFVLFFVIAFVIFKDLTSRPEYNQILVKKPGGPDWWSS
ncbi:uncharacterized protein LOC112508530 [Cynara cardunculus var. scolymus]|uniref:GRIP/coiled-coil protein n=1 Tax=Cynara cardunculus var. scolymus TaxID=59895 RepID=A0A124SGU9_CYNCS|nr:uncharacterized protein LOC112508530 [Cynara cardunculus var. scolymus]XP_024968943.1 uncharacterized protein LOC112508530 [Cynara cardunculus var. scolymus]KVI07532.1 hypothetical protein Ccrd_014119 [Cynara cardunculus var. scolymus]